MALDRPPARGAGLPRRHPRAARLAQRRGRSARSAGRTSSGASPPATWTRWSTATRRTGACAPTTRTRRAAPAGCAPIARSSSTRSAAARRSATCPSSSAASRRSLRRIAHYDYWSRQGAALGAGRRARRPARLRQRRARHRRDRAPPRGGRGARRRSPTCAARRSCATARPEGWTELDSRTRRHARAGRAAPRSVRDGGAAPAPGGAARRRRRAADPARARATSARSRAHGDPHAVASRTSRAIRCCTRTRRASCTSRPTRATRARSCSATAIATSGSTRRRCRWRPAEMDALYELPYTRRPHPGYGDARIPAYEMIRFSVTIMRGCFGGCSFCSITEHEGRVIQSRSRGRRSCARSSACATPTPGFTGVISDLGGPTANMYRLACKDPRDRGGVPPAVVRVPRHLRQPGHRSRAAHRASTARRARSRASRRCLIASGAALRPRGDVARVRARARDSTTSAATSRSRPSTPRTARCSR